MNAKRASQPSKSRRKTLRRMVGGFTLIEILVAVGIVALVAVGIAQIFGAVGETVTRGRQIARFNQLSAQIERQMREDFAAMTRDGFLVIRQQFADRNTNGSIDTDPLSPGFDGIEVTEEEAEPRPRRIDEILFFRRGDFVSAREPIHPDLIARSNEAMIYYGHGRRAYDDGRVSNEYSRPRVGDPSGFLTNVRFALGRDDTTSTLPNPNRFASDWTLLRKVTLLVDPSNGSAASSAAVSSIADSSPIFTENELLDNPLQVAGQPAAFLPFRTAAANFPFDPSGFESVRGGVSERGEPITGLVDIATTSLDELRGIVLDIDATVDGSVAGGQPLEDEFDLLPASNDREFDAADLGFMRWWMLNALPADSLNGERIRYEPEAPDYFGVLTDDSFGTDALAREVARADQLALSSANFVPRCTEFIVEWSFGQTSDGQIIWYGSGRDTRTPRDDIPDELRHYNIAGSDFAAVQYEPFDGRAQTDLPATVETYVPTVALIYGADPDPTGPATATFGFVDPTFNSATADDLVMPWPWPELIRVTVTIADEIDPTIEQTFQFVLEAPGTPDPE